MSDWPLYRKRNDYTIAAVTWDGDFRRMEPFVGAHGHMIDGVLTIHTLEGDHRANVGDYIIRGVKGEFYPCKPDIFERTNISADTPAQPTNPEHFKARDTFDEREEKERRIYYQDIVYTVCALLDRLTPRGEHVVCGTIEEPSTQVQDRVRELVLKAVVAAHPAPPPAGEVVSREAVLKLCTEFMAAEFPRQPTIDFAKGYDCGIDDVMSAIRSLPSLPATATVPLKGKREIAKAIRHAIAEDDDITVHELPVTRVIEIAARAILANGIAWDVEKAAQYVHTNIAYWEDRIAQHGDGAATEFAEGVLKAGSGAS